MPKIVWIEDDYDIIEPVVRPLQPPRGNFEICAYRRLQEVLDDLDTVRTCDLILLDILFPVGTGILPENPYTGVALLAQLRGEGIDVPVIALTVVASAEVHERLRDLGVKDIVMKPVLPSELKLRVEAVLAQPKPSGG